MSPQQEQWVLKYLLSRLSEMWQWHNPRKVTKASAAVYGVVNGKSSLTGYRCKLCQLVVDKVQIDHRVPKGPKPLKLVDLIPYIERYFCSEENLQTLCLKCHKSKTKVDIGGMTIVRTKRKVQTRSKPR